MRRLPTVVLGFVSLVAFCAAGAAQNAVTYTPCGTGSSQCQDALVVTDFNTGTATVYEGTSGTPVASWRTGASPDRAVASPDGRLLFVPNINSNFMSVIDATIGAEIDRIPGVRGSTAAITADGGTVVTSDFGDAVNLVNAYNFSVRRISLDGQFCDDSTPQQCDTAGDQADAGINGIATAGSVAYLNNNSGFRIEWVDTATGQAGNIPGTAGWGMGRTDSIAATADGNFVLATRAPNRVLVINTGSKGFASYSLPFGARSIAIARTANADGSYSIYFGGWDSNGVGQVASYSFNNGALTAIASATLPLWPRQMVVSPDGSLVYATDGGTNIVTVSTSALVNNPNAAVVAQFQSGTQIDGLSALSLNTVAPAAAPVVSSVSPSLIVANDPQNPNPGFATAGSNFGSDSLIRIGNLAPAPLNPQFQALPPSPASQVADVIVTNPSSSGVPNASGILRGALTIATPPSFQPANQVVVPTFGDASVSMLNVYTGGAGNTAKMSGAIGAGGVAVSNDGSRAYVIRFYPPGVTVFNLLTNQREAVIDLPGDLSGQTDAVLARVSPATNLPVVYVSSTASSPDGSTTDLVLSTIDANTANTASATYNTVIASQNAGLNDPNGILGGALAATSDGRYVYGNATAGFYSSYGWLVVFDTVNKTATPYTCASLGAAGFQGHIEISPDNKWLILTSTTGALNVYDISTNPTAPALAGTIAPVTPANLQPVQLLSARIPHDVPTRVYGFDPIQNVVESFNFDPTTANYAPLAQSIIPGPAGTRDGVGLEVTPDGKLVYAVLMQEDDIAALDGGSLALLTKIGTGFTPGAAAVRPGSPVATGSSVSVQPIPTASVTFDQVVTPGGVTVATTNTSPYPTPAGFQPGAVPVFYDIHTTATFSGSAVVCFTYDPAQFASVDPTDIRVLHYDSLASPAGWTDITVSVNTTTHQACGQTSSFSPFVVGVGSPGYLFDTLNQAIASAVQPSGVMNSMRAKVLAAKASYDRNNTTSAADQLNALQEEINALAPTNASVANASSQLGSLINALLSQL